MPLGCEEQRRPGPDQPLQIAKSVDGEGGREYTVRLFIFIHESTMSTNRNLGWVAFCQPTTSKEGEPGGAM